MNDKSFNSALLLAILLTLVAVFAQKFFPQKRFLIWPNNQLHTYFFSSTPGQAFWVDEKQNHWRCVYPEMENNAYFACSFNVMFERALDKGMDLSSYSHLNIHLKHSGTARRVRIYVRNFDQAYSKIEDYNSTKFNAVTLHTHDLNGELKIGLDELFVADWWLSDYDIPRELSHTDLRNAMTLGLEYAEGTPAGNQDITIEKIEFAGEWISAENWYLLILASWMLGIFSYSIFKLAQLKRQTKHDVRIIHQLSDNNARLQLEKDKFRHLSTVDSLTQVYNRFGIDNIITTLVNLNKATGEQRNLPDFALILIDIDHFKRINDRRGHDAGDRVLQNITAIISQIISTQDFLGRWGGEEFIVIMPDTHKEDALILAEKIRLIVHGTIFEPNTPLSITISVGVSDKLEHEDFASCFKRADNALYAAKAQGRNCCVIADKDLSV